MDAFVELAGSVPAWVSIAVACAAFLLAAALALALREVAIRAGLSRVIRDAGRGILPEKPPRQAILKRRIAWLEKKAEREHVRIFELLDASEAFLADFRRKKSVRSMRRLLVAYPDRGALESFRAALARDALRAEFLKLFADDSASFRLTRLANSNDGAKFDGRAALRLFKGRLGELRELSGDPEWAVRFFSATILVEDDDPASERLMWEFLGDSSSSVRKLVISRMRSADTGRLLPRLRDLFLLDANGGVREAARNRLKAEFPEKLKIEAATLGTIESLHVLELLDEASSEDANIALGFLGGDDLERRLEAARFLDRTGFLERALKGADFGDGELLARSLERLSNAASVGVCGFLGKLGHDAKPASACLALSVLERTGDRGLVAGLAKRAFEAAGATPSTPDLEKLYAVALRAVKSRGTREAAEAVAGELESARGNPERIGLILRELPAGFDEVFAPVLLDFLEDADVEPEQAIRDALKALDASLFLPRVLDVVKARGDEARRAAKIRVLRLLCGLGVPYAMQAIVEALPELDDGDLPVYAGFAFAMDEGRWKERVAYALASSDGRLRTAMIRALPGTGGEAFRKEIREALTDADPDVRLAAVSAIAESGDSKALNANAVDLLRDPVERVRRGAALSLGKAGGEAVVESLKAIALDPNESASVVEAAFEGLGASPLPESVDALAGLADRGAEMPYADACMKALAGKTERKALERLLERFKDSGSGARELISAAFPRMGEKGEKALMDLLADEITTLKPYIAEALEASGFIDARIARLAHRAPEERRAAARDLSLIANAKAFKGIVLAARDPDPEIRVLVTKALDFLNSPGGVSILEELSADPDKRVRRYTAWAVERYKARSSD